MAPPAEIDALVEAAVQEHRAGRLDAARAGYEAVLRASPGQWRAAHNLAVLLLREKRFGEALPLLQAALANEPPGGRRWTTYVQALTAAERFEDAERELAAEGRAADPQHRALEVRMRQGWGHALVAAGDLEAAERQFRRVKALAPDDAEAHADLGYVLMRRDEAREAETVLRRALELAPDNLRILLNLGSALRALGRVEEAEQRYRQALDLEPGDTAALRNLAILLGGMGRHQEMVALVDSLPAQANGAIAAMIRGAAFSAMRRFPEAQAALDRAVALAPDDAMARFRRGDVRLLLRDFEGGWPDYDARWGNETFLTDSAKAISPQMRARFTIGATRDDVRGKRVLLVAEQGLGDQVMFASMLPDLVADAASVTCLCDRKLVRLFRRSFPQVEVIWERLGAPEGREFDVYLPMGGLGRIYRRRLSDFPGAPFLDPDPSVRQAWAERLGAPAGLRVGISWKGGTRTTRTVQRSLSLAQFAPILTTPGCEFVSLQYGDVAAEVAAVNATLPRPVRLFEPGVIEDYEEVAGLVRNLDLVVSVQTAVVHLCGALGADCLTLIPYQAEWRYTAEADTMPWYRSVRLFRQPAAGDWDAVIAQVAGVLGERLRERSPG